MIILLVWTLIFLVLISAFFSASEIGMISMNRYRLKHLAKEGHKQALRVSKMLERPDYLLSVVLIGNTLANIIASMVATLLGQYLYGEWGVVIATVVLTIFILIFSEMLPKTIAAIYAERVAFLCAGLLMVIQKILSPLVWFVTYFSRFILSLFGVSIKDFPKETLSGEELRSILLDAGGILPPEHKKMLVSLLDIEKATVEDIMIPKGDLIGIDLDASWHTVLKQLSDLSHTRMPLYRGNMENLVGVVHAKHILHLALDQTLTEPMLLQTMEMPYFIPESTPLNIQIVHFRRLKKRSAFVVDEYGELQGMVTLEDILEEVVGEFTTDISTVSKEIMAQEDGSVLIDGGMTIRDINRILGWHMPLIGPKTLSGLIIEKLGVIPPPDCCLQIDRYYMEVLKVQDNLVRTVRVRLQ